MKKLLVTLFVTALMGSAVAVGKRVGADAADQVHALELPPQQLVVQQEARTLDAGGAAGDGRPASSCRNVQPSG